MPSPDDRLPVWIALSELYLDTELPDEALSRIADILRQSRYDRHEIEHILKDEVAPAFSFNLLSVAGEWAGWNDSDVESIVDQWLEQKARSDWWSRLRSRMRIRFIPEEWSRIAAMLD